MKEVLETLKPAFPLKFVEVHTETLLLTCFHVTDNVFWQVLEPNPNPGPPPEKSLDSFLFF